MGSDPAASPPAERSVRVPAGGVLLDADLAIPGRAAGIVLFAHGSGSSRHSPRNRQVASGLRQAGYATLLMDLLTSEEEQIDLRTRELRFDVGLLAQRLTDAVDWLAEQPDTSALPIACFGASTGAGAALITAAERPDRVRAVISRGGRPDLAGDALGQVRAPVLLIVGGEDPAVIKINEQAAARMTADVEIKIIPGAGHLFEEPGALEAVTELAAAALHRWTE